MKKQILLLFLIIFLFFSKTNFFQNGLSQLGKESFRRLFEYPWAREVFCLEEDEAKEVFGDDGEAYFL